MSLVAAVDLVMRAGDTFSKVFRYGAGPTVYKAITLITRTAPVSITCPGHGLVDGWPVAITNVLGMVEINADANNTKARDYHRVTVVSADAISINSINAGGFSNYKSGGTLQFPTPVDLSSFSAELRIYPVGGLMTVFSSLNGDIVLDNVAKTITLTIDAIETMAFPWSSATYDFNLIQGATVVSLAGGNITVDVGTGTPLGA